MRIRFFSAMALTVQSHVVVSDDQVSTSVGGEVVILGMHDGVYYGLDPVGARIWQLLQTPRAVSEIVAAIVSEFAVTPLQCETDALVLLSDLMTRGLVREAPPAPASGA